jgi:hypothetical protein
MPYKTQQSNYGSFILIFVFVKVLVNCFAISHFGFHRDELLHLALGDHLSWGYKEVPPFIGFLAAIVNNILGGSVIATRIFPTIFSGLLVWFTGQLVVEFGGKRYAIVLACLMVIFSPAFIASGYLFQPVIFDQVWWVLVALLLVKYTNIRHNKYLYLLGLIVGLGILTKYTMIFFVGALIIGLIISNQRKILLSKPFLISVLIAFIIILPNIIWQLTHHIPTINHMKMLRQYQLDYNHPTDFIKQQFLVHGMGTFIWVTGFLSFFLSPKLRRFIFLDIAYIVVFIFLLIMDGKHYYLFPAYPMLFAAGAFMTERLINANRASLRTVAAIVVILPNLVLLPLVLPVLPIDQTVKYIAELVKDVPFTSVAITWEDQKQHPLTQDYADMLGWEEMVVKTARAYHSLPAQEQSHTVIFTDNYGEAAAFFHYSKQYKLPQIISFSSSFTLWAPEQLTAKNLIYISDDHDVSDLEPIVESTTLMGEVSNPLAREHGTAIFLLKNIKPELRKIYHEHYKQAHEK